MLGVQCIVSLFDVDENNGSTGLVSESQHRDFYIDMCYSGYYDKWFSRKKTQPIMPKGSLLMYNCRVLHSSMPNLSDKPRPALLMNYLDGNIVEEVRKQDNIWNSQT
jgi:ectoine hydroxylase-related dioxygenase (phytanoyl-CoA dioxygenase family)